MHGTGGLEVVLFGQFSDRNCKKKVVKNYYNSFIRQFNDLKAQVRCKVIETTLQYQIRVCYW